MKQIPSLKFRRGIDHKDEIRKAFEFNDGK